jgi:hypothetical protein
MSLSSCKTSFTSSFDSSSVDSSSASSPAINFSNNAAQFAIQDPTISSLLTLDLRSFFY